ncbi:MAG TPA: 50S ribosomal protein L15e [archaeon]|nr:50S ribosomal protein L15e [archaeon]
MSFLKQLDRTLQLERKKVENKDYDYKKINHERLISYRREPESIVEVNRPTNLRRARQLGYRAKQGIVVARIRIRKGSGLHLRPNKGRRPKRMGVTKLTRRMSIQGIAEQRVHKKYANMEVMNSYKVAQDGQNKYFEVILIDPFHPGIQSSKEMNWIIEKQHRKRALRGLTSAQKKSRGLHKKGKNVSKNRPSLRAHQRKAK